MVMAFSYSYTGQKHPVRGGRMRVTGTFTSAAAAGSDIVTGFGKVLACGATANTAVALGCKESSTAGTITIYATNDGSDNGEWWAEGN
jgi:hypothetical protein